MGDHFAYLCSGRLIKLLNMGFGGVDIHSRIYRTNRKVLFLTRLIEKRCKFFELLVCLRKITTTMESSSDLEGLQRPATQRGIQRICTINEQHKKGLCSESLLWKSILVIVDLLLLLQVLKGWPVDNFFHYLIKHREYWEGAVIRAEVQIFKTIAGFPWKPEDFSVSSF